MNELVTGIHMYPSVCTFAIPSNNKTTLSCFISSSEEFLIIPQSERCKNPDNHCVAGPINYSRFSHSLTEYSVT